MKEIKFRMWSIENEEMYEVTALDFIIEHVSYWFCNKATVPYVISKESLPFDQCKLMQFTGLSDKNGKSIYAGDILQLYSGKYLVKWECNHYLHPLPYEEILNIGIPTSYVEVENGEIIGNVYENPELLK